MAKRSVLRRALPRTKNGILCSSFSASAAHTTAISDAVIGLLQSGDKPGSKRIAYYTAPAWVNSKDDRAYCFTVPKDAK